MKFHRLLLGLMLGACGGEEAAGPGRIDVAWTGADTGRLQVPATARWCANDSLVEISGAMGDSGVALALMPADSILPRSFPVGLPIPTRSRPTARVALRWPGETLLEGYYGLSGSVMVDSGSALSGRVEATLKNLNNGGEISVSGTFRELTVLPGSAESCGLAGPAPRVSDSSGR
jgi:hypothetical protein